MEHVHSNVVFLKIYLMKIIRPGLEIKEFQKDRDEILLNLIMGKMLFFRKILKFINTWI